MRLRPSEVQGPAAGVARSATRLKDSTPRGSFACYVLAGLSHSESCVSHDIDPLATHLGDLSYQLSILVTIFESVINIISLLLCSLHMETTSTREVKPSKGRFLLAFREPHDHENAQ
jgi:hypothetical protein